MSTLTAEDRVRRQRETFRPFVVLVVTAVVLTSHLQPAVVAPLVVFAVALVLAYVPRLDVLAIAAAAGAAVALAVIEPATAAPQLAAGSAVWLATIRLPVRVALAAAGATAVAVDVALGLRGHVGLVVGATLLLAFLAVVAHYLRTTRAGERRLEILLGELETAREEQLASAALAERSRIARELHDVLAHSLSGAAIQLQGARVLAEREHATDGVREAIDQASELVRDGLSSARDAVDALHGDAQPGVAQLAALVAGRATLTVDGEPRPLRPEVGLALYRGVQEALTNASRYATGAPVDVALRYEGATVRAVIENGSAERGLDGVGGGRGLSGLRERVEQLGGTLTAGATADGWRVAIEVPA